MRRLWGRLPLAYLQAFLSDNALLFPREAKDSEG